MNGLGLLALILIIGTAVNARLWCLRARAATQKADHHARLLAIANHQRDTARAERDDARNFADEALVISGLADAIARHPAKGTAAIAPALSIVRGI